MYSLRNDRLIVNGVCEVSKYVKYFIQIDVEIFFIGIGDFDKFIY